MTDKLESSSSSADGEEDKQLLTKHVFIDTSAYISMQFDWNGRLLGKFAEFARSGRLKLLTTEITNGEVRQHLREAFDDAVKSVKKSAAILDQLSARQAVAAVEKANAFEEISAAFSNFLERTRAVIVPLRADLAELFTSYFERRPPFGEKKKHEFPDAVVVASLSKWCAETKNTAYIVCKDPDLKACCTNEGPFYHVESVAELISQATVSKSVHDLLENRLKESDTVAENLSDEIIGAKVRLERVSRYSIAREITVEGKVSRVNEIKIHSVNIVDRVKNTFTCEIEFEAQLVMDVEIEVSGFRYGYDEYEPGARYNHAITEWHTFVAEIIVEFDPRNPDGLLLDSVFVLVDEIEVDPSNIDIRGIR